MSSIVKMEGGERVFTPIVLYFDDWTSINSLKPNFLKEKSINLEVQKIWYHEISSSLYLGDDKKRKGRSCDGFLKQSSSIST